MLSCLVPVILLITSIIQPALGTMMVIPNRVVSAAANDEESIDLIYNVSEEPVSVALSTAIQFKAFRKTIGNAMLRKAQGKRIAVNITNFKMLVNTSTRLIASETFRYAQIGEPERIKNPELFWGMMCFAAQYELRGMKLRTFIRNALRCGLLDNRFNNRIINYYFDAQDLKLDAPAIKWLIFELLPQSRCFYRIHSGTLFIFEEHQNSLEYLDFAMCPSPASDDQNEFDSVRIYYPGNIMLEDHGERIKKYVLLALLAMIPGCRVSIPAAYDDLSLFDFSAVHRLLNRRGNFAGITSLNSKFEVLLNNSLSGVDPETIEYLDVAFGSLHGFSPNKPDDLLINLIKKANIGRIRLSISYESCRRWSEIFDALPACNGKTRRPVVIEKLYLNNSYNIIREADLGRLHAYKVERLIYVSKGPLDGDGWVFDRLRYLEGLKSLTLFVPDEMPTGIVASLLVTPIEVLTLCNLNYASNSTGIEGFLESILRSESIKTLILNLATGEIPILKKKMRAMIDRTADKMISKVILCKHNAPMKIIQVE